MKKRRATIAGGSKDAAVTVTRIAVGKENLVYVIAGNKRTPYGKFKSRIVYIGTTKRGINRVLGSVAGKARQALASHGTNRIEVHVYSVKPRQNVKMWRKLERGLILAFKDLYGDHIPKFNSQGKGFKWTNEDAYFAKAGLKNIIRRYES